MKKTEMAPHTTAVQMVSSGSVMKHDRRASKPLMEKRRRERINKSLNELKSILLNALRKDQSACHSKLEKADILEMTVRYLKSIQRQRVNAAIALDPNMMNKYRNGFMECRNEVASFIENSNENMQPDVKARLMNHLGNNMSQAHPMIGQAPRSPRLLTTTPALPAVNAISPLQIQMSPNTHMQQAMVTAAAIAQSRNLMQQQQRTHGVPYNLREVLEARRIRRDSHGDSSALNFSESRVSPCFSAGRRSPKHVRRNSGSSCASSSVSPLPLSPSSSPHKFAPELSFPNHSVQGSFVVIPQNAVTAAPPPISFRAGTQQRNESPSITRKAYPSQCVSPITPTSSPVPVSQSDAAIDMSSMTRSHSPISSSGSDCDDAVWRPW